MCEKVKQNGSTRKEKCCVAFSGRKVTPKTAKKNERVLSPPWVCVHICLVIYIYVCMYIFGLFWCCWVCLVEWMDGWRDGMSLVMCDDERCFLILDLLIFPVMYICVYIFIYIYMCVCDGERWEDWEWRMTFVVVCLEDELTFWLTDWLTGRVWRWWDGLRVCIYVYIYICMCCVVCCFLLFFLVFCFLYVCVFYRGR